MTAYDEVLGEEDAVLGSVLLEEDGATEEVPLFLSDVDYRNPAIALGYATTVHKAQGSQWPRVIIPIKKYRFRRSLILDVAWIYTAITRGQTEVIFVGDDETVKQVVKAPPKSKERCIGFLNAIRELLQLNL